MKKLTKEMRQKMAEEMADADMAMGMDAATIDKIVFTHLTEQYLKWSDEELRERYDEANVHHLIRCSRCGKSGEWEEHTCPFAADIHNDITTMCDCCPDCEHECAMDI